MVLPIWPLTMMATPFTDDSGNTDVYNAWNQLIAVNNTAGTTIAIYAYDGMGRRKHSNRQQRRAAGIVLRQQVVK